MNKEEMMSQIAKLECEIKNLKDEINKQEEPKLGRWKPKMGRIHWFIDSDGSIFYSYWDDAIIDNRRYKLGNIFKTEEEAKFAVEQLKILAELKEHADNKEWDGNTKHWCISYDTDRRSIDNDGCFYSVINTPFNIYFSSKEQAQKAINAIGEERLKKYYFCVEE